MNIPRTELDNVVSPFPATSETLLAIHTHVPLADFRIAPLGLPPSLLFMVWNMVFPLLPTLTRETHTTCDLIAVSLEQV